MKNESYRPPESAENRSLSLKSKVQGKAGERVYFALKGNVDNYAKVYRESLQSQIERLQVIKEENESKKSNGEDMGTVIETIDSDIDSLKSQITELDDPKKVNEFMRRDQNNINSGNGFTAVGGLYGTQRLMEKRTVSDSNEHFVASLKEDHDRIFDSRLESGQSQFAQEDNGELATAQGIGLAALESGDIKTASYGLAFAESVKRIDPESQARFDSVFTSLSDPDRTAFEDDYKNLLGKFKDDYKNKSQKLS